MSPLPAVLTSVQAEEAYDALVTVIASASNDEIVGYAELSVWLKDISSSRSTLRSRRADGQRKVS
jgi:hypothetical protein